MKMIHAIVLKNVKRLETELSQINVLFLQFKHKQHVTI